MLRFKIVVTLSKVLGLTSWIDEDGDLFVQRKPLPDYTKVGGRVG